MATDDPLRLIGGAYVTFDGQTWPRIHGKIDELEWALRYGQPTDLDRLVAASVVAAYTALVEKTQEDRRRIVAKLRQAEHLAAGGR